MSLRLLWPIDAILFDSCDENIFSKMLKFTYLIAFF